MKILTYYISGFGKLAGVGTKYNELDFGNGNYDFNSGVTEFVEENGWGKSTFAAFLLAMFYGLDEKGGRKKTEREKYRPWQQGSFGGEITFEKGGKKYLLTRTFGNREAEDKFELRDAATNLVSSDFSANIGEEIFGLDKASFVSTVFLSQNNCGVTITDKINARVGNMAEIINDMDSYENANSALTALINQLTPDRKTGSIYKVKSEITRLETEKRSGLVLTDSMSSISEKINEQKKTAEDLKKQIEEAGEQQKTYAKVGEAKAKQEEKARLLQNISEAEAAENEAKSCFAGEIPQTAEVEDQIRETAQFRALMDKERSYALSAGEQEEYGRLKIEFASGTVSEADLTDMLDSASQMENIYSVRKENELDQAEKDRLQTLEGLYASDDTNTYEMMSKWRKRNAAALALEAKKSELTNRQKQSEDNKQAVKKVKSEKNGGLIALVVGVVFLVAGVLLLMLFGSANSLNSVSGTAADGTVSANSNSLLMLIGMGAMIIVGLIAFLGGIVMLMLTRSKEKKAVSDADICEYSVMTLSSEIKGDENTVSEYDLTMTRYLSSKKKSTDADAVEFMLQEIEAEKKEYAALKEKQQHAKETERTDEYNALKSKLDKYLSGFGKFASLGKYKEQLYSLRVDNGRYAVLSEKFGNFDSTRLKAEEASRKIRNFREKYSLSSDRAFESVLQDVHNYLNKADNLKSAKAAYETFVSGCDEELLAMNIPEQVVDPDEVAARIASLNLKLDDVRRGISDNEKQQNALSEKYEEWEGACDELELKKIQLSELSARYNIAEKSRECLENARNAIMARYTGPIMRNFIKYAEMITGEGENIYHMDARRNITLDEAGAQRSLSAFSCGYQDFVGIALRAALADVMFEGEKPVLILDDPFTNLDDKKARNAMNFLKKLSEDYQIIYFTCSKQRSDRA